MENKLTYSIFSNLSSLEPIQHLIDLRLEVFHKEIGFQAELEIDDQDLKSTHFDVRMDGKVVGTARFFEEDGQLWMGRLAVKKEHRGHGIAKFIINAMIDEAKKKGFKELHLHALCLSKKFYDKTGAVVNGPSEMIEDQPHVPMVYKFD